MKAMFNALYRLDKGALTEKLLSGSIFEGKKKITIKDEG